MIGRLRSGRICKISRVCVGVCVYEGGGGGGGCGGEGARREGGPEEGKIGTSHDVRHSKKRKE